MDTRGVFGRTALRHINDEGFVHGLAVRVIVAKNLGYWLIWFQCPLECQRVSVGVAAWNDSQGHVWRVETPAQRVGVFFENQVAQVVHQKVILDCHHCC